MRVSRVGDVASLRYLIQFPFRFTLDLVHVISKERRDSHVDEVLSQDERMREVLESPQTKPHLFWILRDCMELMSVTLTLCRFEKAFLVKFLLESASRGIFHSILIWPLLLSCIVGYHHTNTTKY